MPRGVMVIAETQQEAEQQLLQEAPHVRVLRSREIDFTGLPPLRGGPLPKHWVVVVEHGDPEKERQLLQHEDPETECERGVRQMYLAMSIDPELLSSGVIEQFDCPACDERVRLELPPRRDTNYPEHAACPECRAPLRRPDGQLKWDLIDRTSKPYPRCLFCDERANSREHVVPAWISKRFGIKDFLALRAGTIESRRQDISFASYRARIFCGTCNTHFKHLEDAVIPLLVPMARGRIVCLGQDSQALLALWAAKTAMGLVAAVPELRQVVPPAHRELVRTEARVPDELWVAYFPWDGSSLVSTARGIMPDPVRAGQMRESYAATLAFAKLGFQVTGFVSPLGPNETIDRDQSPLQQFWPPKTQTIHWPPPGAVDNTAIPDLLRTVPLHPTAAG